MQRRSKAATRGHENKKAPSMFRGDPLREWFASTRALGTQRGSLCGSGLPQRALWERKGGASAEVVCLNARSGYAKRGPSPDVRVFEGTLSGSRVCPEVARTSPEVCFDPLRKCVSTLSGSRVCPEVARTSPEVRFEPLRKCVSGLSGTVFRTSPEVCRPWRNLLQVPAAIGAILAPPACYLFVFDVGTKLKRVRARFTRSASLARVDP